MPVAEHRFVALEPAETEHEGYEGHEATASMRHHDHCAPQFRESSSKFKAHSRAKHWNLQTSKHVLGMFQEGIHRFW